MSVPARAARTASRHSAMPRALAVPVSESVMLTPVNLSWWRRRLIEIACDQPAPFTVSYAVYVAFDNMISGMWFTTAVWYGMRPGARVAFDARNVTTY